MLTWLTNNVNDSVICLSVLPVFTCWKQEGFFSVSSHGSYWCSRRCLCSLSDHEGSEIKYIHGFLKGNKLWGHLCSLGSTELHFWPTPSTYIAPVRDFHRNSANVPQMMVRPQQVSTNKHFRGQHESSKWPSQTRKTVWRRWGWNSGSIAAQSYA